jgi:hypothetical protein
MTKETALQLFEQKQVRSLWNEEEEKWYFSIVDVVEALTDSVNPTDYFKKIRKRDTELGSYIGTNSPKVTMLTNGKIKSIEIRKELTDEWKSKGLKEGAQFTILTDIITKAWSEKNTKEYKILKGLKKENLRDNRSNTELILNMLAEASTKDISQAVNPKSYEESQKVA